MKDRRENTGRFPSAFFESELANEERRQKQKKIKKETPDEL